MQLNNSMIYTYQFWNEVFATASPGGTNLTFPPTSCRSAALSVIVGWPAGSSYGGVLPGASITIQVAQTASDPQLITVPDTSEQHFDFNLDGGPFDIDSWFTTDGQDNADQYYLTGSFDCYTPNGKA
ncbi:MAG: hypothetical protein WCF25_08680 [Acidimicrobiales bacterium]